MSLNPSEVSTGIHQKLTTLFGTLIQAHNESCQGLQTWNADLLRKVENTLKESEQLVAVIDREAAEQLSRYPAGEKPWNHHLALVKITPELLRIASSAKECARLRLTLLEEGWAAIPFADEILDIHSQAIDAMNRAQSLVDSSEKPEASRQELMRICESAEEQIETLYEKMLQNTERNEAMEIHLKRMFNCIRNLERTLQGTRQIGMLHQ